MTRQQQYPHHRCDHNDDRGRRACCEPRRANARPGDRHLDVVRKHLTAGRVCRFGLAVAHTVGRTSGDVVPALVSCRGIGAPPRRRGGRLYRATAITRAALIDIGAAVRTGHRRRSPPGGPQLLRRITVGLLNNGSSAIEPKRSADDREAAPTSPLFLIITVIGPPP